MTPDTNSSVADAPLLDPAFAALLCCPVCPERPPLRQTGATLVCGACGRVYPIDDGLPDLRPESGVVLGVDVAQ